MCYDNGMGKKILVLQNVECEGLGSLANILTSHGYDYKIVQLAKGEGTPQTLKNYAGLIILGGPMNVYQTDQFPFLLDADRLIKQAININKPLLGICLGSQLIAKALNTKVYAGEKKEIGWGSQIRSYVLDQSRIKDLRTSFETGNTQAVLDGDLDGFLEESLKSGL